MIKIVTLHKSSQVLNLLPIETAGLRRLVTTLPLDEEIVQGATVPFDGVLEAAWFDDVESAARAFGCSEPAGLLASDPQRLVTRENVVVPEEPAPSPTDGVKFIALLQRRPDWSPDAFRDYWRVDHAPLVKPTPRLVRYVQSPVVPEAYLNGRQPLADGVVELWWASIEDFREGWTSESMQITQYRDSEKFLLPSLYRYVAAENVLVG